jgi:hypothetical protein
MIAALAIQNRQYSLSCSFRSITKPIEPSERDGNGVILQGANTYHLHEVQNTALHFLE